MKVKLIRKLSDCIDGVDLRSTTVGTILDLPPAHAYLLIAEQWAVAVSPDPSTVNPADRATKSGEPT